MDNKAIIEKKTIELKDNIIDIVSQNKNENIYVPDCPDIVWCFKNVYFDSDIFNLTAQKISSSKPIQTHFLSNKDQLMDLLEKLETSKKLILITSGSYAKELENILASNVKIHSAYIYCFKKTNYEEWIKKFQKIKFLTEDYKELEEELLKNLVKRERFNSNILADIKIKGGYYFDTNQSCVEYIYLESIYSYMNKENMNLKQAECELIEFMRIYIDKLEYKNMGAKEENERDLQNIETAIFDNTFEKDIITWYTKHTFFYSMLNNTLRGDDIVSIFSLRYPIYLMNKKLNELKNPEVLPEYLYRGAKFHKSESLVLKNQIGNLLFFKGFISTSAKIEIPLDVFSKKNSSQK
jgi:hypothetical protein